MLELITKLFSVKPGSMRAWRWRRVLVVVWLFPLFGLIAMWTVSYTHLTLPTT